MIGSTTPLRHQQVSTTHVAGQETMNDDTMSSSVDPRQTSTVPQRAGEGLTARVRDLRSDVTAAGRPSDAIRGDEEEEEEAMWGGMDDIDDEVVAAAAAASNQQRDVHHRETLAAAAAAPRQSLSNIARDDNPMRDQHQPTLGTVLHPQHHGSQRIVASAAGAAATTRDQAAASIAKRKGMLNFNWKQGKMLCLERLRQTQSQRNPHASNNNNTTDDRGEDDVDH